MLQTIIALIIVILLANISLKLLNRQMLKQNKIIKVIERTSVLNNSAIAIVEVCGEYYLMSFTDKDNKILKVLDADEVKTLIEEKESKLGLINIKDKANFYFEARKKI
jgi:flagellar protein FliO/FliZ